MPQKPRKKKSRAGNRSPVRDKSLAGTENAQPAQPATIPSEQGAQRSRPSSVPPKQAPIAKTPQPVRHHEYIISEITRTAIIGGVLVLLLVVLFLFLR
ncbi:MAG: hypothetical protein Q8O55_02525 [Dehalococcoidales bacterium]|nr:hypothetical protein [Dehalococcoidales bacterium]